MSTLLVKNAEVVLTMDGERRQIRNGGIFVRDNVIEKIAPMSELPAEADRVIDASGMIVLPGLINTHHHFYQTLTRAVPGAENHKLFDWLVRLYPIWGEMGAEEVYVSTKTAMAEMILSGCTTSSDHLYLYPHDATFGDQVRAAEEIGMRFHPTQGSMSLGRSKGGLPPDHVVKEEDVILKEGQQIIERYHDPSRYSMLRVTLAPCSPFSVTTDLMRESAKLARSYEKVRLHTHVAETKDEESFTMRDFNLRPARLMEELGWVGPDVWWAHSIYVNDDEIRMMAETGTGVAHCPSSNMRLGSGICRVREQLDAGVNVSLGVDGSASNDSSNMFEEARHMLLLQRVKYGAEAFTVQDALDVTILGGAKVLGRDDIGVLEPGYAADFIGVDLNTLSLSGGAVHDPLSSLLLCSVNRVDFSVINGKVIVEDGEMKTLDLESHIAHHNQLARKMVARHPEPERYKLV
ncbi:MAG: 8-oxoguanine deaminase [Anaerolineaceae bacterium]|nr:8-oxoguanine deaminase [Anaerolineaceae bacterium]